MQGQQETSCTGYAPSKQQTKSGKRNWLLFFSFLHLCKSPDSCTGVCACVSLSICVCVCFFRVCEFCFPSATTSSDNDNDNACTAIRDLLQLTLCFLSTKTHLFTYYYYFLFSCKIFSETTTTHTPLVCLYIQTVYMFVNAFVHVNKIINN